MNLQGKTFFGMREAKITAFYLKVIFFDKIVRIDILR